MSEDFKNKLDAYWKGGLSLEEQKKIESELDKLELYQSYLDEIVQDEDEKDEKIETKHAKRWVRRGKWKARFANAWTAISIFLLFLFAGWIITVIFYSWGSPDRSQVYTDTIRSAVATTKPNITVASSGTNIGMVNMNFDGELKKWIGDERETIGEVNGDFLFNFSDVELSDEILDQPYFIYPEQQDQLNPDDGFQRLEKLPEGTVSELFLSFNKYFSTNDILAKFEDENMIPAWFAVDTGVEISDEHPGPIDPLGFPYMTIGLVHDEIVIEKKEGNFPTSTESTSTSYSVKSYGDGVKRNKEFMKMLTLMKDNESITETVTWASDQNLEDQISYIKENGVRIYGMVVTGPTKELLELEKEDWVKSASVGEVRLWNWRDK